MKANEQAITYLRLYLPMWIWVSFSLFTVACFFFGFHQYNLSERETAWMLLFLSLVHVFFICGYTIGVASPSIAEPRSMRTAVPTITKVAAIFSIGYVAFTLYVNRRFGLVSLATEDLAVARSVWISDYQGTWLGHAVLICSIGVPFIYALGMVFWRSLQRWIRIVYIVVLVLGFVLPYLGGARSGFYAMLVYVVSALLIRWGHDPGRTSRRAVRAVLIVGTVFGLFLWYSSRVSAARMGATGDKEEFYSLLLNSQERVANLRVDHPLFFALPGPVALPIIDGTFYFGHGYYALGKAMAMESNGPGFGVASSDFFVRNIGKYFGSWIYGLSYYHRLVAEQRYSSSLWGTAYVWIASDVTFTGSIVLFGLIGMLFGRVWRGCIDSRDVFSVLCFMWLAQFVSLIHNAYIAGDYGAMAGFYSSIALFLWSRRHVAPRKRDLRGRSATLGARPLRAVEETLGRGRR